jgi:hypothetical protein
MASTLLAVPISDRRRLVRERIDEAIAFRDDLGVPLSHRVDAGFLDTWRSLV